MQSIITNPPIEKRLVNGMGMFCFEDDPFPNVHCRFDFDESVSDALYEKRYHSELALLLSEQAALRKVANESLYGGGLLKIFEGVLSIEWMSYKSASEAMDEDCYAQAITDLRIRYLEILGAANLPEIYRGSGLSGVFLAMPSRGYFDSDKRVMIIGQETKAWRDKTCEAKLLGSTKLTEVEKATEAALACVKKKPGRIKFFQFYKKTSSALCLGSSDPSHAALWANQFCISYKKGSPTESDQFESIKRLSYELLREQFKLLKPDIAIFTVGSSRDRFIKECFEAQYKTIEVVVPDRLWHFKIGKTDCFRTNHPRWSGSAPFLQRAIELAKSCT